MPEILDGNRVRDEIKAELKPRISTLTDKGRPPGLAVVLVGSNPASEIYVRNKVKTCEDLGIHSETLRPPERDRKSTRLNSSHLGISYAVFCLKKKKGTGTQPRSGRVGLAGLPVVAPHATR